MASEPERRGHGATEVLGVTDAVKLPWWKQASHLTALAALIAAMVPLTAAVNGLFQLKQQERLQLHEIRIKYLDRAIDPSQTAEYRERVLSFLLATLDPTDPMHSWAAGESDILAEVVRLRASIAEKERESIVLRFALQEEVQVGTDRQERLIKRIKTLETELKASRIQLAQKEADAQLGQHYRFFFGEMRPVPLRAGTPARIPAVPITTLFVLDIPSRRSAPLSLDLADESNTVIWSLKSLVPLPGEGSVTVSVPDGIIRTGIYTFMLYEGVGRTKRVAGRYRFEVV